MKCISTAAVIGAGIAGLACADRLSAAGVAVTVFDKGRRPGGRVATRRTNDIQFDHGAQYATARDAGFQAVLSDLQTRGAAAPWPGFGATEARWIGVPGMSALPAEMAALLSTRGVILHFERHAAFLHQTQGGWTVRHMDARSVRPGSVMSEGGEVSARYDAVVLAIPAPQAIPLLEALGHADVTALQSVRYAPCWAVMAAFSERLARVDAQKYDDGPLRWVARQGALPGRPATPDAWVLHAAPAWSRDNLERAADEVAAEVLAAFAPTAPPTLCLSAHRWRYALVETPLGRPCLWDENASLGVCGDFCLGPRIEAAWQSGTALASAVVSHT